MSDEFEDLLGGEPADESEPALRTRSNRGKDKRKLDPSTFEGRTLTDDMPMTSDLLRPVGISLLAEIMGKQPVQIRKRLSRCPVVGTHKHAGRDQPLYDFVTAMAYLIEPKGNIEEWFANKNAATLPPYVNKMFWDSAHQRNRVMLSSNDLWHSDDVLALLGRIGLTIKEETLLWLENMPGRDELSDKQFKHLSDEVSRLQHTIRERMMELPTLSETTAMAETIRDELSEAGVMPDADV
jgi:hypothetical protein